MAEAFLLNLALTGASVAYQRYRQRKLEKENDKNKQVEVNLTDSPTPLLIPFGRNLIGGVKSWTRVSDNFTYAGHGITLDPSDVDREPGTGDRYSTEEGYYWRETEHPQSALPAISGRRVYWNGEEISYYENDRGAMVNTVTSVKASDGHTYYRGASVGTREYGVYRVKTSYVSDDGNLFSVNMEESASGSKNEFLFMQQAVAVAGISRFVDFEVDGKDKEAEDLKHGLRIHGYPAGAQADPLATANGAPSTNLFSSASYITIAARLNRDEYNYNGAPDVLSYVEGLECYDIVGVEGSRTLSATKSYTNNPALVILEYLTNVAFGGRIPLANIDLDAFAKARDICDIVVLEDVPVGGKVNTKAHHEVVRLDGEKRPLDDVRSYAVVDDDNAEYQVLEAPAEAVTAANAPRFNIPFSATNNYQGSKIRVVIRGKCESISRGLNIEYNCNDGTNTSLQQFTMTNSLDSYEFVYAVPAASASSTSPHYVSVWLDGTGQEDLFIESARVDNGVRDIKLYEANIAVDSATEVRDNVVALMDETLNNADLVWSEGSYKLKIPYSNAATPTLRRAEIAAMVDPDHVFTDDDIIDVGFDENWGSAADRLNHVTVSFSNEYEDFREDTVSWPPRSGAVYAAYYAEDNERDLATSVELKGITDPYHALAKAEHMVRESRTYYEIDVTLNEKALTLEIGDFIQLSYTDGDLQGELFRVGSTEIQEDFTVKVGAYRFDPEALPWNVEDDVAYSTPRKAYGNVNPPRNVAVTVTEVGSALGESSGYLTWTAPASGAAKYRVNMYFYNTLGEIRSRFLGETSQTEYELPALNSNTYWFSVQSMSSLGILSREAFSPIEVFDRLANQRVDLVYADTPDWTTNEQSLAPDKYAGDGTTVIAQYPYVGVYSHSRDGLILSDWPVPGTDPVETKKAVLDGEGNREVIFFYKWLVSDGISVRAIPSRSNFVFGSSGTINPGQSVTIGGAIQGLDRSGTLFSPPIVTWSNDEGVSTTVSGDSLIVDGADFDAAGTDSVSFTITVDYSAEGLYQNPSAEASDFIISDTISLYKLEAGSDALTMILTNEAHVLPTSTTGVVQDYTGSATLIKVFQGATLLTYDSTGTAKGTYRVSDTAVEPLGTITPGSIVLNGIDAYVQDHSGASNAEDRFGLTFTVTGTDQRGEAFTISKTQSITKAKEGLGIDSVTRSGDEFTVTYTNSATDSFTVNGIASVDKTGDTLTVTYDDGSTSSIVDGSDGNGISSINKSGTTVTVTYDDATTANFTVEDGVDAITGETEYVYPSNITKDASGTYSRNSLDFDVTFYEGSTKIAKNRFRIARSGDTWGAVSQQPASIADELNTTRLSASATVDSSNAVVKVTYSNSGRTSFVTIPVSIISNGIGISSVNKAGETVTISYDDGSSDDFTVNGVASASKVGNTLTLTYDDGTTTAINDGDTGDAGNGIADVSRTGDIVTVTYEDTTTSTFNLDSPIQADPDPVNGLLINHDKNADTYDFSFLDVDFTFRQAGATVAMNRYRMTRSGGTWSASPTSRAADIGTELNAGRLTATANVTDATAVLRVEYSYAGLTSVGTATMGILSSGLDGSDASSIRVYADTQAFTFDPDNNPDPASQDIVFNVSRQNVTDPIVFTTSPTTTLTGTGDTRTLSVANFGISDTVTVIASVEGLQDRTTVYRVRQGASAISSFLTNESHTIPAGSTGTVSGGGYSGSGTTVSVLQGATALDFDATGTANGTFTVTATGSNITPGARGTTGTTPTRAALYADHSGMSAADTASVDYVVTGTDFNGTSFSVTKTQSLTKSKAGATGATGYNGSPGTRGPGRWNIYSNPLPTNSSSANSKFISAVGSPVQHDQAWFYTGSESAPTSQRVYIYNGSYWTQMTVAIDGSLVVNGSITAGKIYTPNLSSLSANLGSITGGQMAVGTSPGIRGIQINQSGAAPDAVYIKQNSGSYYGLFVDNNYFAGAGGGAAKFTSNYGYTLDVNIEFGGTNALAALNAASTSSGGGRAQLGRPSAYGGWAGYATAGGWGPFTGAHDGLLLKADSPVEGDILVDDNIVARSISDVLTAVSQSSTASQRAAIGVFVSRRAITDGDVPAALYTGDQPSEDTSVTPIAPLNWENFKTNYDLVKINSVGEGSINVIGEGGNLSKGDLIVTSSVAGKGMKQSDDIVRGLTVAKCREDVVFSSDTEEKQVACIYLCG